MANGIDGLIFKHGELLPCKLANPVTESWDAFWKDVCEQLGKGRVVEFGAHLMAMEQADKPVSGFLLGKQLHGQVIFIGRVFTTDGGEDAVSLTEGQKALVETIQKQEDAKDE